MVSMLASVAVDRGFEPRLGQTKDYEIGICCFSAKHTALRRNSKYWLARDQNNVSGRSDMSTRGHLPQVTDKLYHTMLVVICTDCTDRWKSNYDTITTSTNGPSNYFKRCDTVKVLFLIEYNFRLSLVYRCIHRYCL
jgi:hypothetical protein